MFNRISVDKGGIDRQTNRYRSRESEKHLKKQWREWCILVFVKDSVLETTEASAKREQRAPKARELPEVKDESSEYFTGGQRFFEA